MARKKGDERRPAFEAIQLIQSVEDFRDPVFSGERVV